MKYKELKQGTFRWRKNMKKWYKAYDIFINSTKSYRLYSKKKAIEFAQRESANLFNGHKHVEVVDTETGEIIFNT